MKIKTLASLLIFFVFLSTSTSFSAQSVAELAKKERERRESLKDKKSVVITNEDLARIKRKPALETNIVVEEAKTTETTSGGEPVRTEFRVIPDQKTSSPSVSSLANDQKALEEAYQKAKEYTELLTLKLNALWQEFYSLDDMTPRDTIQQAIAETFLKLQKAQEEEEKLRKELENYLSRTKKESVPPIWIR